MSGESMDAIYNAIQALIHQHVQETRICWYPLQIQTSLPTVHYIAVSGEKRSFCFRGE